ncbi:hypothetical protein [Roseinatronobacter sp.]|uniref:hypothetical protein n=1 Tax=Roseinatronobacter sp. TaxID=1945755 RepID=UPI003F7292CF
MSDKTETSEPSRKAAVQRIAFDHLVMIRLHMESLVSLADQLEKVPFSPHSVIKLRHAFLDIRLLIEELMLLSVSAHEEAGEVISKSLRTDYQADRKMSRLRALNARFFPDAIDVVPSDETELEGEFVQVSNEYITEQQAKTFYNKCGEKLHANWKQTSADTYTEDVRDLSRFIRLTSRLLKTFEIDISGQGYMMLGHLNLGESGPPSLFFTRNE